MANLFIIGNGFDMAHGIKSSYEDFHKYLQQKYGIPQQSKWILPYVYPNNKKCQEIEAANFVMKLVSLAEKNGELWCDFENSLGYLDYARFFESQNMDEYIKMTQKSLEISIPLIKKFFADWIESIYIDNIKGIETFNKLIDAENDYFVSFNYTLVLEKIYGAKNVCHVHGNTKNNIIMGHGNLSEMKLITMDDAKRVGKKTQNERMFKIKNEKSNYTNEYLTMEDINLCMFYMCDNGNNRAIKGKVQDKLYRELYYLKEYSHRNIRYNRREERNEILRPTNSQIIQIENVLNKIHSILSKNTSEALKTIIKFINEIDIWETIDNIYSIGFSYSDVDMKVIQIISLLGANAWYLNNYNYADLDIQIRKIKKCSFYRIGQFDFTKELI